MTAYAYAAWSILWQLLVLAVIALAFALAMHPVRAHAASLTASWYSAGARTANGERFRPDGMTAASRTLRFGTRLRVCYHGCVGVRINDRGPYVSGRQLDLARGAARAIGMYGVARVTVAQLTR